MRIRKILAAVALALPLVVVGVGEPAAADSVCEVVGTIDVSPGYMPYPLGNAGIYDFNSMTIACEGLLLAVGSADSVGSFDALGNFIGDFATNIGCTGRIEFTVRGTAGLGMLHSSCGMGPLHLELVPTGTFGNVITSMVVVGTWVCFSGARC